MYNSDLANGLVAITTVVTIVGVVLGVLLVVAVLRMWSHTAAMRRELEAIRASVAPAGQLPPAAPLRKPGAF
ncbi:hypothetical protein [Pseudonocardia sp. NPDC049154]|uniref:hypothetical protein n=1 Tax=Pseudonocardia sp. NPDC049154 TaxID=3155501 RepID=UPI00340DDCE7